MSDLFPEFYCKLKVFGNIMRPFFKSSRLRNFVKATVYFKRIKKRTIIIKPAFSLKYGRIGLFVAGHHYITGTGSEYAFGWCHLLILFQLYLNASIKYASFQKCLLNK